MGKRLIFWIGMILLMILFGFYYFYQTSLDKSTSNLNSYDLQELEQDCKDNPSVCLNGCGASSSCLDYCLDSPTFCYLKLAVKTKEASYCHKIIEDSNKSMFQPECYRQVALDAKNISICNFIENEFYPESAEEFKQDFCISEIQSPSGNKTNDPFEVNVHLDYFNYTSFHARAFPSPSSEIKDYRILDSDNLYNTYALTVMMSDENVYSAGDLFFYSDYDKGVIGCIIQESYDKEINDYMSVLVYPKEEAPVIRMGSGGPSIDTISILYEESKKPQVVRYDYTCSAKDNDYYYIGSYSVYPIYP